MVPDRDILKLPYKTTNIVCIFPLENTVPVMDNIFRLCGQATQIY